MRPRPMDRAPQPLAGIRVVVTRAAHQAEELARPLRDQGAHVILLPTIAIAPAADLEKLRRAARNCNQYDWLIFTSANAVDAFTAELPFAGLDCKPLVATVGASTRAAAERAGFRVSITPEKYIAESLAEAFVSQDLQAKRVLLPSAAVTRDVIATEFAKRGAQVDVVEAYRNVIPAETKEQAPRVFNELQPDWVTFGSSSAVDHLVSLIGTEPLSRVKIATIGPVTSETIRKHGLMVNAEARMHSIPGLVMRIVEAVASCKTSS